MSTKIKACLFSAGFLVGLCAFGWCICSAVPTTNKSTKKAAREPLQNKKCFRTEVVFSEHEVPLIIIQRKPEPSLSSM
ncbi:MAG: hypothetical protein AAGJ35_01860 [Myxococcota bacterium]